MRGTNGVAKLGAELLNDEGETSRNLVEHCVAERPMWLRRDLLLGVSRRHFQLQQRVKVIWILQNRSQTSHSSRRCDQISITTMSVLLQFVTVLLWIFAHDDGYWLLLFSYGWLWQFWKLNVICFAVENISQCFCTVWDW